MLLNSEYTKVTMESNWYNSTNNQYNSTNDWYNSANNWHQNSDVNNGFSGYENPEPWRGPEFYEASLIDNHLTVVNFAKLLTIHPSPVLHFLISRVTQNITVDTLYAVCNRDGCTVRRIVIRDVLQDAQVLTAMIEFKATLDAQKIFAFADGREIFQDSCQIKANFANVLSLNVTENNNLMWDYELKKQYWNETEVLSQIKPEITEYNNTMWDCELIKKEHLTETEILSQSTPEIRLPFNNVENNYMNNKYLKVQNPQSNSIRPSTSGNVNLSSINTSATQNTNSTSGGYTLRMGNVKILDLTCSRLFNLFCQYGVIDRIRIGGIQAQDADFAYVEMKTMQGAAAAYEMLNHSSPRRLLWKSANLIKVSMVDSFPVSEGDKINMKVRSYDDCEFNCEFSKKKYFPNRALYFSGAPLSVTAETLRNTFSELVPLLPLMGIWLNPSQPSATHKTGFLLFRTVDDALNVLLECGFTAIPEPDQEWGEEKKIRISFTLPGYIPNPNVLSDGIIYDNLDCGQEISQKNYRMRPLTKVKLMKHKRRARTLRARLRRLATINQYAYNQTVHFQQYAINNHYHKET